MQQTYKGCCQPEGRVSAGAGRINRLGQRGAREGNWDNSWSKEKSQCWGATEPVLCGAGYDLAAVGTGISTLVLLARHISVWSSTSPEIPHSSGYLWPGKLEAEGKLKAVLVPVFTVEPLASDWELPEMSPPPRYCRVGHGDILSFLHSCHFYTLRDKLYPSVMLLALVSL